MWSYLQYRRLGKQVEAEFGADRSAGAVEKQTSASAESSPTRDENGNEKISSRHDNTATHNPHHSVAVESNEKRKDSNEGQKISEDSENQKNDANDEKKRESITRDNNNNNKKENSEEGENDEIKVQSSGNDEPLDPKNWSLVDRSKNIAILAFLIFVQAWAGAAGSIANSKASEELHVGKVAENLSTGMYLLGIGTGAFFAGPLSETFGRNPVYLSATFCYLFFVLGTALTPTFGGRVICRYFVGLFTSATLSINGGSVRDQFRAVKRSFVFPIIAWANVAAPVIAPIAGGWIVAHTRLGWRWTEWMTLIISSAAFLIAFFFLPETYLPVLLDWKAKHLRRVTGKNYVSEHAKSAPLVKRMREALPLPVKFFSTEPVIAVLGTYLVLLYTLLFTFLSGFDYIFKETYGLPTELVGSCFGAIAAGATAFTLLAPGFYSWARHHTEHIQGATVKPEFRLWPAIVCAPLLPVALFWLGWTNYPSISKWSGLGACFLFGIVLIALYVSSYEYIIDSYGDHAAMGLTSITMVRYIIAAGMVMAARPMYMGIGVHWTMTFLGILATILAPAPLVFKLYGPKLRKNSKYAKGPDEV